MGSSFEFNPCIYVERTSNDSNQATQEKTNVLKKEHKEQNSKDLSWKTVTESAQKILKSHSNNSNDPNSQHHSEKEYPSKQSIENDLYTGNR